eukprot:scaffold312264_cov27-Tisochrysis_lutea.AAC.2
MLRNLGSEGAFRMLDAYLRRMSSDRTPSPEAADDVSTTGGGAGAAARSFTSTAAVVAATCVSTATSSTACCLRTSAAWPSARSDSCNMTLRVVGSVPSASKDASAPDTHRALDELELIDSEMRVGAEAVGSAVGGAGVTAGTSSSSSGCTSAAMSAEDGSGAEVTAERVSIPMRNCAEAKESGRAWLDAQVRKRCRAQFGPAGHRPSINDAGSKALWKRSGCQELRA